MENKNTETDLCNQIFDQIWDDEMWDQLSLDQDYWDNSWIYEVKDNSSLKRT